MSAEISTMQCARSGHMCALSGTGRSGPSSHTRAFWGHRRRCIKSETAGEARSIRTLRRLATAQTRRRSGMNSNSRIWNPAPVASRRSTPLNSREAATFLMDKQHLAFVGSAEIADHRDFVWDLVEMLPGETRCLYRYAVALAATQAASASSVSARSALHRIRCVDRSLRRRRLFFKDDSTISEETADKPRRLA
jgi:hypothetical protein